MGTTVARLLDFAQAADRTESAADLTARLKQVVAPLGVTSLSVNSIVRPGGAFSPRILIGERWRHWSDVYVRSGFRADDPAVRMLRERTRPFTWSEALDRYRSHAAERVMDACFDHTGCREGFVVPVRESDGALLTATFSGPGLDLSPETRPALHLAGYYYATRGREIAQGIALDPDCPLTPRQLECLRWVHAEKTDEEIAVLLGLSPRTVHNHVEAAKAVLRTSKRGRAAFEAWRRGWFD